MGTSLRRDECGIWIALWAQTYSSALLGQRVRDLYRGWREVLAAVITDAVDDGRLHEDIVPELAAMQLAGLTDGLVVHVLLDDEASSLSTHAQAAVDALIDGWVVADVQDAQNPSTTPERRHA